MISPGMPGRNTEPLPKLRRVIPRPLSPARANALSGIQVAPHKRPLKMRAPTAEGAGDCQ
jgi:hypothetical protein